MKPSDTTILLVDDEPNILMALEFLLQRQGYCVERAVNGAQALEKAAALKPGIVVLDVMMPGMDGFEVARRIRQEEGLHDTKIVFLTARGTQTDKVRGYASGGEYFLVKPFDNDTFVEMIHDLVAFG